MARLFQAIAISTVLTTAWAAVRLVGDNPLGRLRDIGFPWFLRRAGLALGEDIALLSPSLFGQQYTLSGWGDGCVFLLPALLVNLVLACAIGALLVPAVWLLARRLPPTDARYERLWAIAFPLTVLIGAALPEGTRVIVLELSRGLFVSFRAILVASALILFVLVWVIDSRRFASLLRLAGIACALIAAVASLGFASVRLLASLEPTATAAPGAPNILLVSIDSLRADHVHAYGYARETTPHIDALAAQGVRFETVVAPTSWTLPSHMTLLTALDPRDHGVNHGGARLGFDATLLSEVLRDAGYTTAGFVSGPFLDASYGYFQGFDHYDDYTALPSNWDLALTEEASSPLFRVARDWLREWDRTGREKPFFAFLHMWDVHFEYLPPPPHDIFDVDYSGAASLDVIESPEINKDMDPADLHRFISLYDGEIRHTDAYLGKVLDVLQDLGVYDDTLIVVTADHGEEFFEHGNKAHDRTLYDESVLVPLVIRFPPTVPSGEVVPDQVRLQDVAPTILALAGVSQPGDFGRSAMGSARVERDLSPLIRDRSSRGSWGSVALGMLRDEKESIRTGRHKLIVRDEGPDELYDLAVDPGEQEDLAASDPSRLAELRAQYRAHTSTEDAPKLSQPQKLNADQIDGLRALGYVE